MEGLILSALSGDMASREKLIISLEPLIFSKIKKYGYYADVEDLYQEACLCILECLNDYDESKGVHFLGYVKLQLKYRFLNIKPLREDLILDEDYFSDEGFEPLIDYIIDEDADVEIICEDSELRRVLSKSIGQLYPAERRVILLYYFKDMNLTEIADLLKVSYNTAVKNKARGLRRLRKLIK